MTPFLLRLITAVCFIGIGVGGYTLINKTLLKRANRALTGLEAQQQNTPAILYFTTPDCMPCRTTQRPAINRLLETTGEQVQLIEVDASVQPKLAESWGVLSVPTTFVIDSDGQARQVNLGVTSTEKLLDQLEQAAGRPFVKNPLLKMRTREAGAPGTD
ncbi:MAG: thioredoxin family protein [Chloroflexota bacterium]